MKLGNVIRSTSNLIFKIFSNRGERAMRVLAARRVFFFLSQRADITARGTRDRGRARTAIATMARKSRFLEQGERERDERARPLQRPVPTKRRNGGTKSPPPRRAISVTRMQWESFSALNSVSFFLRWLIIFLERALLIAAASNNSDALTIFFSLTVTTVMISNSS